MSRNGLLQAISAFTLWGIFPIFWKLLEHLPPWEILFQRIFWGGLLFAGLIFITNQFDKFKTLVRDKEKSIWLILSGSLITFNWFMFIYLVISEQVLQISLGYFINPIMNVILGLIIFRERLNAYQLIAVLLATGGMLLMAFRATNFPWMGLGLAATFAFYGVLRKRTQSPTIVASGVEGLWMICMALPALSIYYLLIDQGEQSVYHLQSFETMTLFMTGGVVTVIPVLLFASAARKLPLSTVGIIQYIAPSLHFLLAVFVFKEPFGWVKLQSFLLVWAGLLIYTIDLRRRFRKFNQEKEKVLAK